MGWDACMQKRPSLEREREVGGLVFVLAHMCVVRHKRLADRCGLIKSKHGRPEKR